MVSLISSCFFIQVWIINHISCYKSDYFSFGFGNYFAIENYSKVNITKLWYCTIDVLATSDIALLINIFRFRSRHLYAKIYHFLRLQFKLDLVAMKSEAILLLYSAAVDWGRTKYSRNVLVSKLPYKEDVYKKQNEILNNVQIKLLA